MLTLSFMKLKRNEFKYLVTVKAIEQSDTDDSCTNTCVMSKSGECKRLHFHVDDILLVNLIQKVQFFLFSIVAEGPIQATLTYNSNQSIYNLNSINHQSAAR